MNSRKVDTIIREFTKSGYNYPVITQRRGYNYQNRAMNTDLIINNLFFQYLPPPPCRLARKDTKTFTAKTILVRNLDGN